MATPSDVQYKMDYLDLLYKTYQIKIDAKHAHHENFHRWMTFYSVAIGALIVAFYQFKDGEFLTFSIILFGLVTSYFCHMSCKGYRHWTNHWIREIWAFENVIECEIQKFKNDISPDALKEFKVYTAQSEDPNVKFNPLKTAKISTPKVTLAYSYTVFWVWIVLLIWKALCLVDFSNSCANGTMINTLVGIGIVGVVIIIHWFFFFFLARFLYSDSYERISKSM